MPHRKLSLAEKSAAAACLFITVVALGFCAVTLTNQANQPKVAPVASGPLRDDDGLAYIPPADEPFTGEHHDPLHMVVDLPGVVDPNFTNAQSTSLAESEVVIGVVVAHKAYAFSRKTMLDPSRHIVNFVVENRPISVTYCNMVDQTRVLTRPPGTGRIDLNVGGMDRNYQLVVRLDGTRYAQSSTALPLEDYPFEQMTLGQWIAQHPDTLIYEG